jgi:hypothetical protein
MKAIIDQYNGDPLYSELHVLTRDYPFARQMLKTAAFEERKNTVAALPSAAFAWEDERRFPLHTKEDTLASLFYRSKCAFHVPEEVDAKLTAAAQIYKIDRSAFNKLQKTASAAETQYALTEEKRLPLMGVAQIKMAEEVLHRDYRDLTLEKRAEAFKNLHIAARRFQVALAPLSMKFAGVTGSDTQFVREWIEARAAASKDPTHQAGFDKLASAVGQMPRYVSDRAILVKLATTIAQLDAHANLNKYYDRGIPDPLLTVFNQEKVAGDMVDVGGMEFPVSKLLEVPPEMWEQVDAPELGELAASGDVDSFTQAFSTLPLDIKMMIRGNLAHV